MGTDRFKDNTGLSWTDTDSKGNTSSHSKNFDGSHSFYDHETGVQGYHGPDSSSDDKRELGHKANDWRDEIKHQQAEDYRRKNCR